MVGVDPALRRTADVLFSHPDAWHGPAYMGHHEHPGGSEVKAQPHSLNHENFSGQSPRHSAESLYLPAGGSPSYATA